MRTVGCLSILAIFSLTLASEARAQAPVPPPTGFAPPPAPAAPAPGVAPAAPAPAAPAPAAPAPGYPQPSPANAAPGAVPGPAQPALTPPSTQPGAPVTANGNASVGVQAGVSSDNPFVADPNASGAATVGAGGNAAAAAGAAEVPAAVDEDAWYREHRENSLTFGNSTSGGVGLLHMQTPFSGAPGTFRASFLTGYYSGSGFLCANRDACPVTGGTDTQDKAESISSDIAISATLLPYLEGYVGMHSIASSNSFGRPQLLQVVGDTNFGLKLFTPAKPDRIFAAGTSLDLWLLNGSGSLGISNANFTLRALGSVDLTRRSNPNERIPLRFHSSFGYRFDGSGALITDIEKARNGERISRIERFGLDINRVDSFLIGIGAEYVHKVVQPFVEWTFDVPTNYRTDYVCSRENNGRSPGDRCLLDNAGFSTTPSRLTLGTRVAPGVRGLQGLVAFDIGTGATSTFIEEVAPELPWRFFVGIAFAHDITSKGYDASAAPQVVEKVVQLPPPPEYRVVGLVLDEKTQQPIPNAIVKFQGQALTGMVARQDGSFETTNLQPGTYAFAVTADGYREGACTVTVAPTGTPGVSGQPAPTDPYGLPVASPTPAAPGATTPASSAPASPAPATGPNVTNVACPLKPLPAVGAIQGALFDGETNQPVPEARLTIRDAKGRELSLAADSAGAFRFENVPVGLVKIAVDADGYMPAMVEVEVKAKTEQRPPITLNKRPKKASVIVTANEVKLTKQVNFANDSAVITPDSMGLVQEIALTIKEHPTLARIEIQGHTDNSGTPAYNKRLSQERAEAVRNALIALGVESARLTAIGYGQDRALVPNSSDANKARNRRVQLMIQEKR